MLNPDYHGESNKFKKGNPGGGRKPDTFSLQVILKKALQEIPPEEQKSYAELLIKTMLKQAVYDGDEKTQRLIFNYIDGLPQQFIDVTSKGEPIPILGGASVNPDALPTDESDEEDNETNEED